METPRFLLWTKPLWTKQLWAKQSWPLLLLTTLLAACAGTRTDDGAAAQNPASAADVKAYAVADSALQAEQTDMLAYDLVLERVKTRGYADDFRLLREEYIKTGLYQPFDSAERDQVQQMFEALDDNNLKQCVILTERILARNFTSLVAHRAASICFEQLGNDIPQQFHEAMYRGLLNAVARSGNGSSPSAAFVVINADEIDALLLAQDLEVVSQSLQQQGEREYNRIYVRNPQTGRQYDVYFDVSIEKRWYLRRLQSR